jgi:hypothetical protein
MPIAVICPSCKAAFRVSDKFAGKQGPCPKCKTQLTIPAATPEITVHAPEEYATAGKDSKGRAIAKPIPRQDAKYSRTLLISIAVGSLATLIAAWAVGRFVGPKLPIILGGLALLSLPLVRGAYEFLRDDELEPHRGRALWIRSTICAIIYAALWGAFALLQGRYLQEIEMWAWLFVAPPFVIAGATTALACFDLDFSSGAFHYFFYLAVTLILRWLIGMPPIWLPVTS